jgi:putative peptidoglycan lipid II flippase
MTDRAGDEVDAVSSIGRASAVLAAGTLVSRMLGFVSAFVLALAIGITGEGTDAFGLANQLPNNVYAIVAGGLLGAILVPQVVRARVHEDGGQRFVNKVVTLGVLAFVAIAVVVTLCAPLLVRLYAQGGDGVGFTEAQFALATAFAYWCLPQVLFYALYSLFGEILNARGVFGPFTWAPAINNLVAIAGMLVFIGLFGGQTEHLDAAGWTAPQIALLAGSATLGIAAQAFVLVLFWRRAGLGYRPDFGWRGVGLGRMGASAAWLFAMVLVTQVAGIVESRVASLATGDASIQALRYGWLIFMLPHSIVTVSIATAYFTRMSGHVRDGDLSSLRHDVSASLRSILLVMVFALVALAVLSWPFAAVFADTYLQVQQLGTVLLAFLVGLVPFTVLFVLQRVFYSLEDTRTPFLVQVVQAALYVTGATLVGALVPVPWIAVGLALVLSLAGTIQTIVTAAALRRRLHGLEAAPVVLRGLWFLGAAALSALAGAGVLLALGGIGPGSFTVAGPLQAIATMAAAGAAMAVVYVGVLWLTRNPELRGLAAPILRRFGSQ